MQTSMIHRSLNQSADVVKSFQDPKCSSKLSPLAQERIRKIEENGYVIIENALSPEQLETVKRVIQPQLNKKGRNRFEGYKTNRVYGLLGNPEFDEGKSIDKNVFVEIVKLPCVMELVDEILSPNYLLTAYQAININPGEDPQPLHFDEQFIPGARPRKPVSVATIFAINDFTPTNGATVIYPRSHLWGDVLPTKQKEVEPIPCVMPAGSVVLFLSTLWHGGGRNVSQEARCAVSAQYCEPWIRPQENQFLVNSPDRVKLFDSRVQSLVGYSIHPPFIGHAYGQHPLKTLQPTREFKPLPMGML